MGCLLASLMVDFSDGDVNNVIELFSALGLYSLAVITGLFIMILVVYPVLLEIFTKMNYLDFSRESCLLKCLLFLPVPVPQPYQLPWSCEDHLGISKEITSFVLPLEPPLTWMVRAYQAVAAVFIAKLLEQT